MNTNNNDENVDPAAQQQAGGGQGQQQAAVAVQQPPQQVLHLWNDVAEGLTKNQTGELYYFLGMRGGVNMRGFNSKRYGLDGVILIDLI
jgi:hypothetical protein